MYLTMLGSRSPFVAIFRTSLVLRNLKLTSNWSMDTQRSSNKTFTAGTLLRAMASISASFSTVAFTFFCEFRPVSRSTSRSVSAHSQIIEYLTLLANASSLSSSGSQMPLSMHSKSESLNDLALGSVVCSLKTCASRYRGETVIEKTNMICCLQETRRRHVKGDSNRGKEAETAGRSGGSLGRREAGQPSNGAQSRSTTAPCTCPFQLPRRPTAISV